jgi:hypothetical protein
MLFLFPAGKMKTISDAEFASYLLRAKQKLDNPDAQVDPLSQVVIAGNASGKGTKRGRKNDTASASNKIQKLGDDAVVEGGDDDGVQEKVLSPPVKGGRSSRHRPSGPAERIASQGEVVGSAATEGEKSKAESPPIWNEDFDPLTFVSENLKGYSSRLDAMSLEELRKLAAGTGLKCLALNQMVFNRQEKEASDKLERELGAAKEELEKDLAGQLAKSQADFQKSLDREKKKVSSLKRSKRDLTIARNAMIVALVKIWQDAGKRDADISQLQSAADRLHGDLRELEEEIDNLKEQMAGKYVDGFNAAMEQVRALFPGLDGDALAQIDFLKKVEGGKLVSRLPA